MSKGGKPASTATGTSSSLAKGRSPHGMALATPQLQRPAYGQLGSPVRNLSKKARFLYEEAHDYRGQRRIVGMKTLARRIERRTEKNPLKASQTEPISKVMDSKSVLIAILLDSLKLEAWQAEECINNALSVIMYGEEPIEIFADAIRHRARHAVTYGPGYPSNDSIIHDLALRLASAL
jgi:hypothetical protein